MDNKTLEIFHKKLMSLKNEIIKKVTNTINIAVYY